MIRQLKFAYPSPSKMTTLEWIVVAAIAVVAVYLLVMRVFARDSREADKHIDYNKVKKWKDED
jgi:uncharacterized protein (UPF0212 family)